MTAAGLAWRACMPTARASTPDPAPDVDPVAILTWLNEQLKGGHAGTWVVVAVVYAAVKALRTAGGARWPVLRSPAGGALSGAVVSVLGGLLSMGVTGQKFSWELVTMALIAWWGAAGSQSTLKDITSLDFTPKTDPKTVIGNPP